MRNSFVHSFILALALITLTACEKNSGDPEVGSSVVYLKMVNNTDTNVKGMISYSQDDYDGVSVDANSERLCRLFHISNHSPASVKCKLTLWYWDSINVGNVDFYDGAVRIDKAYQPTCTIDKNPSGEYTVLWQLQ